MAGARGSHTCSVLAMHLGCLGVPCGCCVPFDVPLSPVFGITGGTKLGGRSPRSTTRSPACQGCRDLAYLSDSSGAGFERLAFEGRRT